MRLKPAAAFSFDGALPRLGSQTSPSASFRLSHSRFRFAYARSPISARHPDSQPLCPSPPPLSCFQRTLALLSPKQRMVLITAAPLTRTLGCGSKEPNLLSPLVRHLQAMWSSCLSPLSQEVFRDPHQSRSLFLLLLIVGSISFFLGTYRSTVGWDNRTSSDSWHIVSLSF